MPRLPRIHVEGAIYYVTSKGSQNQQIFKDKADYQMYLDLLTKYKSRYGFKLFSYDLQPDRLSLLIETGDSASISGVMHDLTSLYTKYFNGRYGRRGPLFESRFRSVLVEKSVHLLEMTRFIQAGGGEYNSYTVYVNGPARPRSDGGPDISAEVAEVKNFLSAKDDPSAYEKYCLSATLDETQQLEKKLNRGSVFGSDAFAEQIKGRIEQISKEKKEEAPSGSSTRRRTLIFIAGAAALVATSSSLYLYVSKKTVESKYETLLRDKDARFSERMRFENRSPIALTELEGTAWQVDIIPLPAGKSETVRDTIRFAGGRFSSEFFSQKGFRAGTYFLVPKGGGIVEWQTSQSTPNGDTVSWRAEWQGELMKGTLEFRPKNGEPQIFSFFSASWSYQNKESGR